MILSREELVFIQALYDQAGSAPEATSIARVELGERLARLLAQFDNLEQVVISLSSGDQQQNYPLTISHNDDAVHVDIQPPAVKTRKRAASKSARARQLVY